MNKTTVHIAGVDVPKQLFDAAARNELVIFVGAGISQPSGLPNFPDLAAAILESLDNKYEKISNPSEKLERAELDGINIRRETRRIFAERNKGVAQTHKHIVNFFGDKPLRIVTTNFDLNLSAAAGTVKKDFKPYYQPALPTGDHFDGIVYLHGAVCQPDGELVITEKDFARAYLKHGRQTAFIRELFSTFTVLFIGYSYDDKIFQFLTKSDDFKNSRYIFVGDNQYKDDPQKWDVLNLTAIPYNIAEQHKQLWSVIDTWGNITNRQPSEHQQVIKKIVKKRGVLTQAESDYLQCCIESPSLARCFASHATSERWLKWAFELKMLDKLFEIDFRPSEVEQVFIGWFADNFIVRNNVLAFKIIEEKGISTLNPYLVNSIALCFHRVKKLPPQNIFAKWMHILLASQFIERDYISYMLLKCRIPKDNDIVLLLLNKLTSPILYDKRADGGSAEYWIKEIWEKKIAPKVGTIAFELEPIISHHLKLHELQQVTRWNIRKATYISRPAIEENEHNFKHEMIDSLIDMARGIIDFFNLKYPAIAKEIIERWYRQRGVILKRLSLYGMTRHTHLSASEKLTWLIKKKEIFNVTLTHENFTLIENFYPHLSELEKQRFISFAKKEADEPYPLYNLFVWLTRIAPACHLAQQAFHEIQSQNPNFGQREKPELTSFMSTRWGHLSPLSIEDLLALNIGETAKLLDTYKDEGGWDKPEREGLIDTLSNAAKKNFDWSFALAKKLAARKIWHEDIWSRLIAAWQEPEKINITQASELLTFLLEKKNLHIFHYEIAKFLSKYEELLTANNDIENKAIHLAVLVRDIAFADTTLDKVIISEDVPDWWTEAINSTGYYVCYFFIRLFDKKYKKAKNKVDKLNEYFVPFLENESYAARMGKITLAHYLQFLFAGGDKQWTKTHILPLFDWTIDKETALQSWQAYLYRGHWSKELFDDLIKLHQKGFVHFKGLGRARDNYCQHVAGVTLYGVIFGTHDPLKTGWLTAFIRHCEEQDLESFAQGIHLFLRDNEDVKKQIDKVWADFLLPYLDQRISGKPIPLCKAEFRWMLRWCLHVNGHFSECVAKIIEADNNSNLLGLNRNQNTDIFHRFLESEIFKENPQTAGQLVEHLLAKKHIAPWDWEDIKKIYQLLTEQGCDKKTLKRISEALLDLGFSEALSA